MTASTAQRSLPAFLRQTRSDLHNKFVDLEWQQRNRLLQGSQQPSDPASPPSQFSRLIGEAYSSRNRYLNVEPFALNRVKLSVGPGQNDYINASPIRLGKREYIATQGPREANVNHFYHMIESEVKSPAVVVMLTQTHEAGKEKCFQYFPYSEDESLLVIPPENDQPGAFQGEVELESLERDAASRSEIRTLVLRSKGKKGMAEQEKKIHHLLFSGWPDFLVPEGDDRAALIELVRLSRALNSPSSNGTNGHADVSTDDQTNPRIVHCSAGVGRSGTFIALDYLMFLLHTGQLDAIKGDQDPIAETVETLRRQRMMMVQGEGQFLFLYDVLREMMSERVGNGA